MKYYITGDTHGDFTHLFNLQSSLHLFTEEDVLIILGDAGFNYFVHEFEEDDDTNKKYYSSSGSQKRKRQFLKHFPGIVFCIHGNHEARPETVYGYVTKQWNGGTVYYEPDYPRILFAQDGEIYTLNEKEYLVIGGAYSIDKSYRFMTGARWFSDEQPDENTKKKVESVLEKCQWKIHGILSHTAPFSYIPREMFLNCIDQSTVDDSTERWLGELEKKCEYDVWYFGHFHGNKHLDKTIMLFHDVEELQ